MDVESNPAQAAEPARGKRQQEDDTGDHEEREAKRERKDVSSGAERTAKAEDEEQGGRRGDTDAAMPWPHRERAYWRRHATDNRLEPNEEPRLRWAGRRRGAEEADHHLQWELLEQGHEALEDDQQRRCDAARGRL